MKILNWMQSKINGRQAGKRSSSTISSNALAVMQEARQEEFIDWPQGLLAIGTFGNNQLKENLERNQSPVECHSSNDLSDFTPEEVGKLQIELTKILKLKPASSSDEYSGSDGGSRANLPLDKFLNCPSSLEVDRLNSSQATCDDDLDEKNEDLSRSTSVVKSKSKEVCSDNNNSNNAIRQKSISFLLKKMFVCHGGFAPSPSFRDQIPESRMEKILRTILHKKIYPQGPSSTSTKKYLVNKQRSKSELAEEEHVEEKATDQGCKWVKTDSDFIVLEI